uniref:Uncharacterized protein n=1 Tax=Octopus bimaculoides TaxID=37653 RepID=A0A0L8GVW9_OCTBM
MRNVIYRYSIITASDSRYYIASIFSSLKCRCNLHTQNIRNEQLRNLTSQVQDIFKSLNTEYYLY